MNIKNIKAFFKNKIKGHKEDQIYLRAAIHLIKFSFYKKYRDSRCLIDPSASFFYKYRKLSNYFAIPLLVFAKYLKKKIFLLVFTMITIILWDIFIVKLIKYKEC